MNNKQQNLPKKITTGKYRTIVEYNNGDKYDGNWKDGKRNGFGSMYYNNGEKYIGYWKNDKRNGLGSMHYNNGNTYNGNWKDNKRNGKGTLYYEKDDIFHYNAPKLKCKYEGNWRNDKRNGRGVETISNGERYIGDWKNGKKNGRGFQEYSGNKKISCNFSDDCANGIGVIYYDDGDVFRGRIEDNKPNYGTMRYKNVGTYVGNFDHGDKTNGTMYYKNGDKYVGNFDGKWYHGRGTYYFKDGDIVDVMYDRGDLAKDRIIRKVHNNTNKKAIYMQYISNHSNDDQKYFKNKYNQINVSNNYIDIQDDGEIKNIGDINDQKETHLKIFYSTHGGKDRSLNNTINKILLTYENVKIKSIYLSACSCHGAYYDMFNNNLFDDITKQIMGNNEDCIGFVSLVKPSYNISMKQTTKDYNNEDNNKDNTQYGIKRNASNESNESSITENSEKPIKSYNDECFEKPRKYYKDEDFEYYCILNEKGKKNIYKIPADLCYWREDLIDKGIFQEAFEALKNGKDYSFTTDVRDNGKVIKNKKITISLNKNIERIKPVEIKPIESESYIGFQQYEIREVINDEAKNIKQNNNIKTK